MDWKRVNIKIRGDVSYTTKDSSDRRKSYKGKASANFDFYLDRNDAPDYTMDGLNLLADALRGVYSEDDREDVLFKMLAKKRVREAVEGLATSGLHWFINDVPNEGISEFAWTMNDTCWGWNIKKNDNCSYALEVKSVEFFTH